MRNWRVNGCQGFVQQNQFSCLAYLSILLPADMKIKYLKVDTNCEVIALKWFKSLAIVMVLPSHFEGGGTS